MIPFPPASHCDVWRVCLPPASQDLTTLETLLSASERKRAAGFRVPSPRRQFVVARAALRTLLADYLGLAPSALDFTLNAHGKPSLAADTPLRFNLSHAGGLVLIAVATGMEIGVDVEVHRPVDFEALAAAVLDEHDLENWRAAAVTEGPAAFYRVWTCKEAVAKAIGCGMAMDFRALRLGLAPGRPPTLESLPARWGRADALALLELEVDEGHTAALAAVAPALAVTARTFPDAAGWPCRLG